MRSWRRAPETGALPKLTISEQQIDDLVRRGVSVHDPHHPASIAAVRLRLEQLPIPRSAARAPLQVLMAIGSPDAVPESMASSIQPSIALMICRTPRASSGLFPAPR